VRAQAWLLQHRGVQGGAAQTAITGHAYRCLSAMHGLDCSLHGCAVVLLQEHPPNFEASAAPAVLSPRVSLKNFKPDCPLATRRCMQFFMMHESVAVPADS
jgi:hypothetical protein